MPEGQTLRQPYGKKIIGVSEKDIDYIVSDIAEIDDDNDNVTFIIETMYNNLMLELGPI